MNHRIKIKTCSLRDLHAFEEGKREWLACLLTFTHERKRNFLLNPIVKPSLKSLHRRATIVFSSFWAKDKVE